MSFAVHHPTSVHDAVGIARSLGLGAQFLAGGTDLVIQIHRRLRAPAHLVNLTAIPGLDAVSEDGAFYRIGALTRMKTIEREERFLLGPLRALSEAARTVGGSQVRNVGTIGGNIANASPAADLLPPLLAFDAEIELVSADGYRRLALDAFLLGPRSTALRPHELLANILVPRPAAGASVFLKFGRRKAMEISVVSVAVSLCLDADGSCRNVRIALGAVAPRAVRARQAEAEIEGLRLSEDAMARAGDAAMEACRPISDVRASATYRAQLARALVRRALRHCVMQLQGEAA